MRSSQWISQPGWNNNNKIWVLAVQEKALINPDHKMDTWLTPDVKAWSFFVFIVRSRGRGRMWKQVGLLRVPKTNNVQNTRQRTKQEVQNSNIRGNNKDGSQNKGSKKIPPKKNRTAKRITQLGSTDRPSNASHWLHEHRAFIQRDRDWHQVQTVSIPETESRKLEHDGTWSWSWGAETPLTKHLRI